MDYRSIGRLTVPQRHQRLSALANTNNPSPDEIHEMSVLRAAIKKGWTPELQEMRDQRAKKKVEAQVPEKAQTSEVHSRQAPASDTTSSAIIPDSPPRSGSRPLGGLMSNSSSRPDSGITIDTGRFIAAIGAFILAAGIVGFMLWHFGAVEFLNLLMFLVLPVLGILAALGLVKWGFLQMLWNLELSKRVGVYIDQLRREAEATSATPAAS